MRFEIRAGGALLFLIGLAALSGTVFALGLIAGYEMARQNQVDSSQLATSYPMPSPPAAAPTSAPPPALAAAAPGAPPAAVAKPAAPQVMGRTASAARSGNQAPPPAEETAPEESSVPPAPEEEANTGGEEAAPANPPPGRGTAIPGVASTPPATVASTEAPARHHPYNIQIDAVMDSAGAQQMAARLRRLGYTATIVPSTIAGQTWYKVKVGPYASAEEARDAQDRLRAQYNAAYGH